MSHDLTMKNLTDRISICESSPKRNEIERFLKRLITDDEKWITYDNNVQKYRQCKKPGWSTQKKSDAVFVCGGIARELFATSCYCPPDQTIDSNFYCQQLKRLRKAIEIKRPELINRKGVIVHHDNTRHHTSLVTRQKLRAWLRSFDVSTV